MARSPDERVKKAYELYKSGMKLVEIASQLSVPDGTVRRWKSTYKWDGERSDKNSERSEKKSEHKESKKKVVAKEVDSVIGNDELTDKQQLFCVIYIRCFNATKAYQKAYGVDYNTAASSAYRLLDNDRVKKEIQRLKQERLNREFLSESDIFQKYMDIAFSDINDYVKIENGYCISLRKEIDGSIVDSISNSESGVKIKLADRMKALQWLTDHMELATEKQKAEITLLKAKSQTDESGPTEDDGFIEALAGKVDDIWQEE